MSGTSMDGLDIVCVEFTYTNRLNYRVIASQTLAYTSEWKSKLSNAFHLNESLLTLLDLEYGIWLGTMVNEFIKTKNLSAHLIASVSYTHLTLPTSDLV